MCVMEASENKGTRFKEGFEGGSGASCRDSDGCSDGFAEYSCSGSFEYLESWEEASEKGASEKKETLFKEGFEGGSGAGCRDGAGWSDGLAEYSCSGSFEYLES